MNSCKTCKHWLKDSEYAFLDIKQCGKAVMLWDATEWKKAENGLVSRVLSEEYKDQLSFVQDGSDYHASLYTKSTFFCSHFEPEANVS